MSSEPQTIDSCDPDQQSRIVVASYHNHIDNGGYSFSVVVDGVPFEKPWKYFDAKNGGFGTYIQVTDGYYGYSNHDISLHGKVNSTSLREIGEMFLKAAHLFEEKGL